MKLLIKSEKLFLKQNKLLKYDTENSKSLMKKTIFTIIAILFFTNIFAQDTLNFNYVNSKTYEYYLSKNWNSLIILGKAALKNDIDFYYLQVRMGIAYYEKGKYRQANKYFESALSQNEDNALISEYLYYSYLFSGREKDALHLAREFAPQLRTKLGLDKTPFVKNISVSVAYIKNSGIKNLQKIDIDGEDNNLGEQTIINNTMDYNIGLTHRLGKEATLTYNFTQVSTNETQRILSSGVENNFSIQNSQNQFYIKSDFRLANKMSMNIAFNLISVKTNKNILTRTFEQSDYTEHSSSEFTNTLTGETVIVDTYDTIFNYNTVEASEFDLEESNWKDFALSIGLWRDFTFAKIGGNLSIYNLNYTTYFQPSISLITYPFANLNFYTFTSLTDQISQNTEISFGAGPQGPPSPPQRPQGISLINNYVFKQTVGFKITDNLWSEIFYTAGNIYNYADNDVFTIYNTAEPVKQELGTSFFFLMFKNKLKLNLNYTLIQQQNIYTTSTLFNTFTEDIDGVSVSKYTYPNGTETWENSEEITKSKNIFIYSPSENNSLYFNHLITAGLTWYF